MATRRELTLITKLAESELKESQPKLFVKDKDNCYCSGPNGCHAKLGKKADKKSLKNRHRCTGPCKGAAECPAGQYAWMHHESLKLKNQLEVLRQARDKAQKELAESRGGAEAQLSAPDAPASAKKKTKSGKKVQHSLERSPATEPTFMQSVMDLTGLTEAMRAGNQEGGVALMNAALDKLKDLQYRGNQALSEKAQQQLEANLNLVSPPGKKRKQLDLEKASAEISQELLAKPETAPMAQYFQREDANIAAHKKQKTKHEAKQETKQDADDASTVRRSTRKKEDTEEFDRFQMDMAMAMSVSEVETNGMALANGTDKPSSDYSHSNQKEVKTESKRNTASKSAEGEFSRTTVATSAPQPMDTTPDAASGDSKTKHDQPAGAAQGANSAGHQAPPKQPAQGLESKQDSLVGASQASAAASSTGFPASPCPAAAVHHAQPSPASKSAQRERFLQAYARRAGVAAGAVQAGGISTAGPAATVFTPEASQAGNLQAQAGPGHAVPVKQESESGVGAAVAAAATTAAASAADDMPDAAPAPHLAVPPMVPVVAVQVPLIQFPGLAPPTQQHHDRAGPQRVHRKRRIPLRPIENPQQPKPSLSATHDARPLSVYQQRHPQQCKPDISKTGAAVPPNQIGSVRELNPNLGWASQVPPTEYYRDMSYQLPLVPVPPFSVPRSTAMPQGGLYPLSASMVNTK